MLSETQRQKKVDFYRNALDGRIDWASEVIISDQSRFGLFDDSRRQWIPRGEYPDQSFVSFPKHPQSVMVWAAIGLGYKSPLIFIEGFLNAPRYRTMLSTNHIFPRMKAQFVGRPLWFQQDGTPAHTAKISRKFIEGQIDLIPNWSASSSDLSVIENIRGILRP
jgi:hypothetical protein